MSFEGQARVAATPPLLPVAEAGTAVAALAVGAAAYAAYKASCLVARGLVYTAREGSKAWARHAEQCRTQARQAGEAVGAQRRHSVAQAAGRVRSSLAAKRVAPPVFALASRAVEPRVRPKPAVVSTTAPRRSVAASVSRRTPVVAPASLLDVEDRLALTLDLPAWWDVYRAFVGSAETDTIRRAVRDARTLLERGNIAGAEQASQATRERLDRIVSTAERVELAAHGNALAVAAVEAELGSAEADPVLSSLLDRRTIGAVRAKLGQSCVFARQGDPQSARQRVSDAEDLLARAREDAFALLAKMQRDYLSKRVAGVMELMGYGRPTVEQQGDWTVLHGRKKTRPFTVAITEDLRLVFDLGHEESAGLEPCRAEVRRFLEAVAGGVELKDVEMQPNDLQAIQEQTALALTARLKDMGATVTVEQDEMELVITAMLPGENVAFRIGPKGETNSSRQTVATRGNHDANKIKART